MRLIIGFSKSRKFMPIASWLIRLYMWTPFSHIYVRIPFKEMGKFPSDRIVHASEGLVQHMSATVFETKHETIEEFTLDISKDLWNHIKREDLHEPAGENYSILQNIGIVLATLVGIFGINIKNPFKSGWNCSEFALEILKDISPEVYGHYDKDLITPKELYKILKTQHD